MPHFNGFILVPKVIHISVPYENRGLEPPKHIYPNTYYVYQYSSAPKSSIVLKNKSNSDIEEIIKGRIPIHYVITIEKRNAHSYKKHSVYGDPRKIPAPKRRVVIYIYDWDGEHPLQHIGVPVNTFYAERTSIHTTSLKCTNKPIAIFSSAKICERSSINPNFWGCSTYSFLVFKKEVKISWTHTWGNRRTHIDKRELHAVIENDELKIIQNTLF